MTTTTMKPLELRALMGRINRRLAKHECIRRCMPRWRAYEALGRFYTVDRATQTITRTHVHIQEFAESIGAIQSFEALTTDD